KSGPISRLALKRGSRQGRTIRKLKGIIPIRIVVEKKMQVITENLRDARGLKFTLGDTELTIFSIDYEEIDSSCNISIQIPAPKEDESLHWQERIHLEDANGNRYRSSGSGSSRIGDTSSKSKW